MEQYMPADNIHLQLVGLTNERLGPALGGRVEAVNGLGAPCYVLELNRFRKNIDHSFMQGFLISGDVERETAQAHFSGLRRAPADVDSDPNNFKELVVKNSVLKKSRSAVMNMAALGIPTRIVSGLY